MKSRISLMVIVFVCLISVVYVNASVDDRCVRPETWTSDMADNPKDRFLIGEIVRIHAYSSVLPYTLEIWTSIDDGSTWDLVKEIEVSTSAYVGDHDDISKAPKTRMYQIKLLHDSIMYGLSTHFVIPELLFGSAMATLASFGALFVVSKRKR